MPPRSYAAATMPTAAPQQFFLKAIFTPGLLRVVLFNGSYHQLRVLSRHQLMFGAAEALAAEVAAAGPDTTAGGKRPGLVDSNVLPPPSRLAKAPTAVAPAESLA